MVILTDATGKEIRELSYKKVDFDVNDTKDFELTLDINDDLSDVDYKARVFVPGTEFGGIIGKKRTDTSNNEIKFLGNTWRGILESKVIQPPSGAAYKKVVGEVNGVIRELINENGLSGLFYVEETEAGPNVTYQFDRYVTVMNGLGKMLSQINYRLDLVYVQGERGHPGRVKLSAKPIEDLSGKIELSQDSRLNFVFMEVKDSVNHLICLGKGELENREVIHLYADENGKITETPTFYGVDEVVDVYDNTATNNLLEDGISKFKELLNTQSFQMDIEQLGIDVGIGDIVGGRDYITGMVMKRPVTNKIYISENGSTQIDYYIGKTTGFNYGTLGTTGTETENALRGADKHFTYVQTTASSKWEVVHNLNKLPAVTVIDSAGTIVEGQVQHLSLNKVIISFSAAFSGKAYFN